MRKLFGTKSATTSGPLSAVRAVLLLWLTLVAGIALTVAPGALSDSASAAGAPVQIGQCNNVTNIAGQRITCTVSVNNYYDVATAGASSVVVLTVCHDATGVIPGTCVTTPQGSATGLVSSVTQCNDSGNGGGGELICSVAIINHVVGDITATGVTVNQCIGSGTGGGATPLNCDPIQSTTSATVTQCNGSANGGGADVRVTCTAAVPGAGTRLPVLVNQCNNSENGGGSTVTCGYTVQNLITAAAVAPPGGSAGQAETPAQAAAREAAAAEGLAFTGTDPALLVTIAAGALTLGAALMLIESRRRSRTVPTSL